MNDQRCSLTIIILASQNIHKFYHKVFILKQNSRNHESLLPRKFGDMRYIFSVSVRKVLSNSLRFTKFANFFPCQIFPVYGRFNINFPFANRTVDNTPMPTPTHKHNSWASERRSYGVKPGQYYVVKLFWSIGYCQ